MISAIVHIDIKHYSKKNVIFHNQQIITCKDYKEAIKEYENWCKVYEERMTLDFVSHTNFWFFGTNEDKNSQIIIKVLTDPDKIENIMSALKE